MDKEFRKILLVAGLILILFGVLIVWRGFRDMLRVAGPVHGGAFILAGAFFLVLGLAFLVVPPLQARKKQEMDDTP